MIGRKILIVATLLHSIVITKAHAQEKSCHSLFALVRPTDAEIKFAILELYDLAHRRYSKDKNEALIANLMYREKMKDLQMYLSQAEIKNLLLTSKLTTEKQDPKIIRDDKIVEKIELDVAVSNFLAENGFKDEKSINIDKRFPLTVAIQQKRFEFIEPLIARGADVNAKGSEIAFILASQQGYKEIVELFIKHNVDVNIRDGANFTALYQASRLGHTDTVKLLLAHKADPTIKSLNGFALHAAATGGHEKIVDLLIPFGNINAQGTLDSTPLLLASENGHPKVVKTLLENKADPTLTDSNGNEPIIYASRSGNIEIIKLLAEYGVNLNSRTHNGGSTPLIEAARRGKIKAIQFLLDNKVNINETDRELNQTALYTAAYYKQSEAIELLIKNGADLNIKDSKGHTILTVMLKKIKNDPDPHFENSEIIKLLKDAGAKE